MRSGCNQDISQPSIRNPSSFAVVMRVVERGRAFTWSRIGVGGSRARTTAETAYCTTSSVREARGAYTTVTDTNIDTSSVARWLSVGIHRLGTYHSPPMADS